MGAWGPGIFENDSAMNFRQAFEEREELYTLLEPINFVIMPADGQPNYYSRHTEALAAAEIIAAIVGYPMNNLPDRVTQLRFYRIQLRYDISSHVLTLALQAIDSYRAYVQTHSNGAYWVDGIDDFNMQWELNIIDLECRLLKAKQQLISAWSTKVRMKRHNQENGKIPVIQNRKIRWVEI